MVRMCGEQPINSHAQTIWWNSDFRFFHPSQVSCKWWTNSKTQFHWILWAGMLSKKQNEKYMLFHRGSNPKFMVSVFTESVSRRVTISVSMSVPSGADFFRPFIGPEVTWLVPGLSLALRSHDQQRWRKFPLPPYTLCTSVWHQKGLFSRNSTLNRQKKKEEIGGATAAPPPLPA